MTTETLDEKIPKILEQRLLINKQHRKILNTMEKLSPRDTGNLYVPGINGFRLPSLKQIAQELKVPQKVIRKNMNEIKEIWNIPNELPTGDGYLSKEEALISALTNQHKLRWDKEINDYRVPRIHMYSSEIGTGTLYTRNKAFIGENIVRNALGLDELLNSYNTQGGIMPQVMSMYGSLKAEGASLVGLNKTGKKIPEGEVETLIKYFNAALKKIDNEEIFSTLDNKTINNIENFVANTLDSQEEAARSVAHEIAPLYENLPENTPIHWFFSYNDDYNMKERGDLLIAKMRIVREQARKAKKSLPKLKEKLITGKNKISQAFFNESIANYILEHFKEDINSGKFDIVDEYGELIDQKLPKGKKFRQYIRENYLSEKDEIKLKKKFLKSFKNNYGRESDLDRVFDTAKQRYSIAQNISDLDDITERATVDHHNKEKYENLIPNLEDTISEYQRSIEALEAEKQEGHSWFTKKVAMTPTETKAQRMIAKESYKKLYEKILIPELEKIIGKKLNIKLHTDREISVFIPEPGDLFGSVEKNSLAGDKSMAGGTIIASYPRINRQRSNEPTLNSYSELQGKHSGAITARVKSGATRPKTTAEFEKHHSLGFADVAWTSWGAEGMLLQPKSAIAPTRVDGEYRGDTEIVYFLKTPTRHDARILSELAKKGNKGTWEIKRLDKGGGTSGNTIQIMHPDKSQEWIFIDDMFYEKIADKYSDKINMIESKISRARLAEKKEYWTQKLNSIKENIVEDAKLYHVFLANDLHLGNVNMKGRPNNVDYIRGSQTPALQALGFENIHAFAGTEFLNGCQAWNSYNAHYEGAHENQDTESMNELLLNQGLRNFFSEQGLENTELELKVQEVLFDSNNEKRYERPSFRMGDQVDLFRQVEQPITLEMLNKKIPLYIGSGNHFNATFNGTQDETNVIESLYPVQYSKTGLIKKLGSQGNSFTIKPIKLPGDLDGITAMFAHKMWHGNTEISRLSKQAVGTRENAQIYIVADRHHPGMAVERDKFFVLDTGKATVVDYVQTIGKASSVRGTVIMGYSPHDNKIYSSRFFLDDVVDTIIGWPERAENLRLAHNILSNELKKAYDWKID